MKLAFAKISFILLLLGTSVSAQKVTKLTITDNLNISGRFTPAKAKPAAARDTFYLLTEKGTQVLFYADLQNTDSASLVNRSLKFVASKSINGKFEWVDDRVLEVKTDETYVMTAINFFTTGSYKIILAPEHSNEVLAEGFFVITK